MTVKMGELPAELKESIGLPITLKVTAYFSDDLVAAVTVLPPTELKSFLTNKNPHITLAVNRSAGGKPVMSNKMIETSLASMESEDRVGPFFTPFTLTGNLTEVPFAVKE